MRIKLGLTANFKRQLLQWDGATVSMKNHSCRIGKSDLSERKMREVEVKTTEPASTRETTERLVKILNSTYKKAYLK